MLSLWPGSTGRTGLTTTGRPDAYEQNSHNNAFQWAQAGTLWGDRYGEASTGFLARFADGFSSPPHIHNVTYRAVVIEGGIHNDDPGAVPLWMGPGSFWIQPKGEVHITSASGTRNIALVEIDKAPYLVKPPEHAFDSGERPLNLDAANVVWIPYAPNDAALDGVVVAWLWGRLEAGESRGSLLRLPAGFTGRIRSAAGEFRGVVIRGDLTIDADEVATLLPGSYFGSRSAQSLQTSVRATADTVIYIRTDGPYQLEHPTTPHD